ncbi:MAG: hypothetical protein U0L59_03605 [Faecalimonas sp.]|nr:hypothetical protein [Faecalimonas sp.]
MRNWRQSRQKSRTLDKKVIQKFIEVSYQPYYEKYGTEVEGFLQMNLKLSGM